jgi:hypothetical protein
MEEKKDKNGKNSMTKETHFARNALIFGIILMLLLPWLLTHFSSFISFDGTSGSIGDTIGGVTAPISGLLGAYLVFLALKAQVKANEKIQEQIERQEVREERNQTQVFLDGIINLIKAEIEKFSFVIEEYDYDIEQPNDMTYRGEYALIHFVETLASYRASKEPCVNYSNEYKLVERIFDLFELFINKLQNSDFEKISIEYNLFKIEYQLFKGIEEQLMEFNDRNWSKEDKEEECFKFVNLCCSLSEKIKSLKGI